MAQPALTPVRRLEAWAANILNREISVSDPADLALLTRVADRAATHWANQLAALAEDPENPTDAEKAGFVLLKDKAIWADILRARARVDARDSAQSAIDAAGEAAAADMD